MAEMEFRKVPGVAAKDQWHFSPDNPNNWVNPKIKTLWCSPSEKFVNIVVGTGTDQANYPIGEDFLLSQSKRFATCCDAAWKQAGRPAFAFPDEDPVIFLMFRMWITGGDIFELRDELLDKKKQDDARHKAVCLYILAYKLQTPGLQDWIVSAMVEATRNPFFQMGTIELVYSVLPRGSKLQKLLVDSWVATSPWRLDQTDWMVCTASPTISPAIVRFFIDVIERWSTYEPYSEEGDPSEELPDLRENTCLYHEHGKNGFCPWNGKGLLDYLSQPDRNGIGSVE